MPAPVVYTPAEAATILKVSQRTVYTLIRTGKLRAFKLGGSVRIREQDLDLNGRSYRGGGKKSGRPM